MRVLLGTLWLLALLGCGSRLQAPLLRDSPVYRNDREGFRFLVPEGWTQTANTNLPPGELDHDVFLVRYRIPSLVGGAVMQVLVSQDRPEFDVGEFHAGPSFGVLKWNLLEPEQQRDVNGKSAVQYRYSGQLQGSPMIKELVAFRANNRIYAFVALYWEEDEIARQQIERAISSIVWNR